MGISNACASNNKKNINEINALIQSELQKMEEQIEQFDNPSRETVFKTLSRPMIIASNNLLKTETLQNNLYVQDKSKCDWMRQFNPFILNLEIFKSVMENNYHQNINQIFLDSYKQQANKRFCNTYKYTYEQQNKNKCSETINNNFCNTIVQHHDDTLMTFKSFVISSNQLFENYSRISIQNKDFIQRKRQGSYGNVYLAKCKKTNQIRAIKTMKRSIMPQNQIRQFKAQMQTLQQLDHPNIIKLYEIFQQQQQNLTHVVTQYCCGGSLIDSILEGIVFSQHKIKKIFVQLLSALNYLHRNKIVHRDLKLQNLVFLNQVDQNTSQENLQIKIIDFGSSCKIKNKIKFLKNAVGTLSYMAPQIITGYFNQKCDIWSAGVILYILVTGNSPFKGQNRQQTMQNIKQLQLTYDQHQWKTVNGDCIDLIKRMLIKNPQKRISTSSALGHSWFKDISFSNQIFQGNKSMIGNLQQYYVIFIFYQREETILFPKFNFI